MNKMLLSLLLAILIVYTSGCSLNTYEGMSSKRAQKKQDKEAAKDQKKQDKEAAKDQKKQDKDQKKQDKEAAKDQKKQDKDATKDQKKQDKEATKQQQKQDKEDGVSRKQRKSDKKQDKEKEKSDEETNKEKEKSDKKDAKEKKKSDKEKKKSDKKKQREEKRSKRKEKREDHHHKHDHEDDDHDHEDDQHHNVAGSDEKDAVSEQICRQLSEKQFSDSEVDIYNLNQVIQELKQNKINNANTDTLLKYLQHVRILKMRIVNEILYNNEFSEVFNTDEDDSTQDLTTILTNVDSSIKQKIRVIEQLTSLEKSLEDSYNFLQTLIKDQDEEE